MPDDFLSIVPGARGHFRFESGHHSDRWLDLDGLFVDTAQMRPWIRQLADRVRPYDVAGVCGPLTGGAFLAQSVAQELGVEFYFTDRTVPPNGDGMYRVEYTLRPSIAATVRDKSVAIVDDVVSAGSATRSTFTSLLGAGAKPVVVGALLAVGQVARNWFAERAVGFEAAQEIDGVLWLPESCPLCAAGVPVSDPTT